MVVNKPTIIIYTNDPDQEFLHEICSGIEEEGLRMRFMKEPGELVTAFGRSRRFRLDRGSE